MQSLVVTLRQRWFLRITW